MVPDAYTQFADTEAWRKANQIEQLYETIDLEHYDETRRLVFHLQHTSPPILTKHSIPNGPDDAIDEVSLYTYLKSSI